MLRRPVETAGAKRSFNQARKRYFGRHLPAKSDYWELTSIVQNAEARPLGRKQTFTARLQGPVYRRRYPVGGSLPYSDRRFAHQFQALGSVCGKFACLSDARLCIVAQKGQRAPRQLFFYNNKLQFNDLTSNQVVGSSNLSGRAFKSKG